MSQKSQDIEKSQDVAVNNGLLYGYGSVAGQAYGPGLWDGASRLVPPMPVGKVYNAILEVMGELSETGIAKGQTATFEYGGKPRQFRGIDDVMQKLSALLVKHKLLVLPWLETHAVDRKEKQNKSGGTTITHIYTCVWRYAFISVEDSSKHEIRVCQETFDTSDKGLGKNMSYAYKYAMLQAFCVPVEGNEEQDAHNPIIGDEPRRQETKPQSPPENRPLPNVAAREARQREMLEADRRRDSAPSDPASGETSARRAPSAPQRQQYEPPRAKLKTNKYDGQLLTDIPANGLSDYFGQLTHISAKPEHQGALNRRMFEAVTEITARIHLLTTDELAKYAERLERLPKSETGLWNKANAAKDIEWDKRVQAEMKGTQKP